MVYVYTSCKESIKNNTFCLFGEKFHPFMQTVLTTMKCTSASKCMLFLLSAFVGSDQKKSQFPNLRVEVLYVLCSCL